jgi:hypothetical protein
MKTMKTLMLACSVVLLAACGGGAKLGGGKEGAAQALYGPSEATASALQSQRSPLGAGINVDTTVDVKGKTSGTAKVKLTLSAEKPFDGTAEAQVTYDQFNQDGKNTYNGSLTFKLTTSAGAGTLTLTQSIKGKVTLSGEVSDFLDVDVTQTLSGTATPTSGKITVVLNGTIETSTEKYVYNNETITFDAQAKLPVQPTP